MALLRADTRDNKMTTLENLKRYIEQHGFKAHIVLTAKGHAVQFNVPYTSPQGDGYIIETVQTARETREALGY